MADYLVQQKGQPLRSGYYNKDAFRQKGRSVLVLKTAIAGLNFHVDLNSDNGRELLDELKPGTVNCGQRPGVTHTTLQIQTGY